MADQAELCYNRAAAFSGWSCAMHVLVWTTLIVGLIVSFLIEGWFGAAAWMLVVIWVIMRLSTWLGLSAPSPVKT
jgi:hypothetical protein